MGQSMPAKRPPPDVVTAVLPSAIDGSTLLRERRDRLVRHGKNIHRSRLTASNKPIRTK